MMIAPQTQQIMSLLLLLIFVGCSNEFPSPLMTTLDAATPTGLDSMTSMASGQMDASDSPTPNQADINVPDSDQGLNIESDMGRLETPETECNERDDDGDGFVDEGLEIGAPCDTGIRGCQLNGLYACAQDGTRTCQRPENVGDDERCNGLDDDCDGIVDEGLPGVGDPCTAGQGLCLADGFTQCTVDGDLTCNAVAGQPEPERCNFLDDDCDGLTDEELGLTDPCVIGFGRCASRGVNVCGPNEDVVCDAEQPDALPEVCDGDDNDCDGLVDEQGICGPYVEAQCRFYLGWADRREGPIGDGQFSVSDGFGNCPRQDGDFSFRERCNSTRGDGLMRRLTLPSAHTFNGDDLVSVAFQCSDEQNPALAAWMQSNCRISIGYVTENPPNLPVPNWGTCPDADGADGAFRCVTTGGDGRFHTFVVSDRDVREGGAFGIAFICQNDDEDRAVAVQSSVEVTLAWGMRYIDEIRDGVVTWPNCPDAAMAEEARNATCARTQGFGQYIPMPITREWRSRIAVDDTFAFGIGLRARAQD